jgi:hypothetical protein
MRVVLWVIYNSGITGMVQSFAGLPANKIEVEAFGF